MNRLKSKYEDRIDFDNAHNHKHFNPEYSNPNPSHNYIHENLEAPLHGESKSPVAALFNEDPHAAAILAQDKIKLAEIKAQRQIEDSRHEGLIANFNLGRKALNWEKENGNRPLPVCNNPRHFVPELTTEQQTKLDQQRQRVEHSAQELYQKSKNQIMGGVHNIVDRVDDAFDTTILNDALKKYGNSDIIQTINRDIHDLSKLDANDVKHKARDLINTVNDKIDSMHFEGIDTEQLKSLKDDLYRNLNKSILYINNNYGDAANQTWDFVKEHDKEIMGLVALLGAAGVAHNMYNKTAEPGESNLSSYFLNMTREKLSNLTPKDAYNSLPDVLKSQISQDKFNGLFDMVKTQMGSHLKDAKEIASDVKDKAKEQVDDVKDKVKEKAGDVKDKVKEKAGDVKDKVVEKADDVKDKVKEKVDDSHDVKKGGLPVKTLAALGLSAAAIAAYCHQHDIHLGEVIGEFIHDHAGDHGGNIRDAAKNITSGAVALKDKFQLEHQYSNTLNECKKTISSLKNHVLDKQNLRQIDQLEAQYDQLQNDFSAFMKHGLSKDEIVSLLMGQMGITNKDGSRTEINPAYINEARDLYLNSKALLDGSINLLEDVASNAVTQPELKQKLQHYIDTNKHMFDLFDKNSQVRQIGGAVLSGLAQHSDVLANAAGGGFLTTVASVLAKEFLGNQNQQNNQQNNPQQRQQQQQQQQIANNAQVPNIPANNDNNNTNTRRQQIVASIHDYNNRQFSSMKDMVTFTSLTDDSDSDNDNDHQLTTSFCGSDFEYNDYNRFCSQTDDDDDDDEEEEDNSNYIRVPFHDANFSDCDF